MKIRIKFSKQGEMKYIGHLDIMRFFQKAIRRANINISYTEGFSPHQKMSFASPLGVGLISSGEYFDIEVNDSLSSKESIRSLNNVMVDGINVISYKKLPEDAKNCMAIIAAADYKVHFLDDIELTCEKLDLFMNQNEIVVVKKTKKGEKEINIRPHIIDAKYIDNYLLLKLAAGSVDNLKPELVVSALSDFLSIKIGKCLYERIEMYANNDNNEFVSLESLGADID